jgi:hypothetical protein
LDGRFGDVDSDPVEESGQRGGGGSGRVVEPGFELGELVTENRGNFHPFAFRSEFPSGYFVE